MGRRLGQHFLIRESILEKIAIAACGEHAGTVIEIGPGKGALTKHILARADRAIAIEVDPVLVHYLRHKFREDARLTIVENDVLKTRLDQWGPAVVAGNLPYYVTSPILAALFSTRAWIRAVFLVQKEVAERVTAGPGSRDFGYLSVQSAVYSHAELLFYVSRTAFAPPPKVESAVLRLTPRDPGADWGLDNAPAFLDFAALAFQHKRKMLRSNLRERFPAIGEMPERTLRGEQLAVADLIGLFRRLRP